MTIIYALHDVWKGMNIEEIMRLSVRACAFLKKTELFYLNFV